MARPTVTWVGQFSPEVARDIIAALRAHQAEKEEVRRSGRTSRNGSESCKSTVADGGMARRG